MSASVTRDEDDCLKNITIEGANTGCVKWNEAKEKVIKDEMVSSFDYHQPKVKEYKTKTEGVPRANAPDACLNEVPERFSASVASVTHKTTEGLERTSQGSTSLKEDAAARAIAEARAAVLRAKSIHDEARGIFEGMLDDKKSQAKSSSPSFTDESDIEIVSEAIFNANAGPGDKAPLPKSDILHSLKLAPAKRGPGRPRKYPYKPPGPKRPRGRPKKATPDIEPSQELSKPEMELNLDDAAECLTSFLESKGNKKRRMVASNVTRKRESAVTGEGGDWLAAGYFKSNFYDANDLHEENIVALAESGLKFSAAESLSDNYRVAPLFHDGQVSSEMIELPPDGFKILRSTRQCFFMFHCIRGAAEVTLNSDRFLVTAGCTFQVPRFNVYSLRNVEDTEAAFLCIEVGN